MTKEHLKRPRINNCQGGVKRTRFGWQKSLKMALRVSFHFIRVQRCSLR